MAKQEINHLNAYFAVVGDEGFVRGMQPNPGYKQLMVIEISPHTLEDYGKWEVRGEYVRDGKKFPKGDTWWYGGMQRWVANTVYLVTDDVEEVYIFHTIQNSPKHTVMMGKLTSGRLLYEAIRAFKRTGRDMVKSLS